MKRLAGLRVRLGIAHGGGACTTTGACASAHAVCQQQKMSHVVFAAAFRRGGRPASLTHFEGFRRLCGATPDGKGDAEQVKDFRERIKSAEDEAKEANGAPVESKAADEQAVEEPAPPPSPPQEEQTLAERYM